MICIKKEDPPVLFYCWTRQLVGHIQIGNQRRRLYVLYLSPDDRRSWSFVTFIHRAAMTRCSD